LGKRVLYPVYVREFLVVYDFVIWVAYDAHDGAACRVRGPLDTKQRIERIADPLYLLHPPASTYIDTPKMQHPPIRWAHELSVRVDGPSSGFERAVEEGAEGGVEGEVGGVFDFGEVAVEEDGVEFETVGSEPDGEG
jgi:hypothetical protein